MEIGSVPYFLKIISQFSLFLFCENLSIYYPTHTHTHVQKIEHKVLFCFAPEKIIIKFPYVPN